MPHSGFCGSTPERDSGWPLFHQIDIGDVQKGGIRLQPVAHQESQGGQVSNQSAPPWRIRGARTVPLQSSKDRCPITSAQEHNLFTGGARCLVCIVCAELKNWTLGTPAGDMMRGRLRCLAKKTRRRVCCPRGERHRRLKFQPACLDLEKHPPEGHRRICQGCSLGVGCLPWPLVMPPTWKHCTGHR